MNIKDAMKELKLNQSYLAKAIGAHPSQISLYVNGIVKIPKTHIDKIEHLLKEKRKKK